ncbi:protein-L-isoaspartate O-methyltransferase family protein [Iodidimonas gelatinilytica]|nr:protein-L-isoaspartate O-methyltransferase [Iodidimonas gelatinilytica]
MRNAAMSKASAEDSSKAVRLAMIEGQIRPNRVSDERVLDAIRTVPREQFVPKFLRGVAYLDEDLEIAEGRYLMEPMVFARLVMAADIKPDDVVLDIGAATGYSTAVLSRLAETVVAVEEDADLAGKASTKLSEQGCDNAVVIEGKLVVGAPDHGPFDVIVINGAVETIADSLMAQLADHGRLVCVRQQDGVSRGVVFTKTSAGDGAEKAVGARELFDAFTPVLPGFSKKETFRF